MFLNKEFRLHTNVEEYLLKYAKKYSILYVDDDESYRELMKDILSMFFDNVIMAKDGVEALKLYKEFTPKIVITDINMPQMDGLQLIEEIQKVNLEVSFIILTGFIENKHLLKALELGINKYLIKPLNKEELARLSELYHKTLLGQVLQFFGGQEAAAIFMADAAINAIDWYLALDGRTEHCLKLEPAALKELLLLGSDSP